jgi:hypothetical protein
MFRIATIRLRLVTIVIAGFSRGGGGSCLVVLKFFT